MSSLRIPLISVDATLERSSVVVSCCCFRFVTDLMSSAVYTVAEKQGVRKALSRMLSDDLKRKYLEAQRVPDWVQLYLKLSTKLPNKSWQTRLNFLNIGRSGVSLCLLFVYVS